LGNVTILKRWINGVESSAPNVYQQILLPDQANPGTFTSLDLNNNYNGGYKFYLDRSGKYIVWLPQKYAGVYDVANDRWGILPDNFDHFAMGSAKMVGDCTSGAAGVWDFTTFTWNNGNIGINHCTDLGIGAGNGGAASYYYVLSADDTALWAYDGPSQTSTNQSYFNELRQINLATKAVKRTIYAAGDATGWTGLDLRQPMISPDGSLVAWSTNLKDRTQIFEERVGACFVVVARVK
jgi:hypothetical protein